LSASIIAFSMAPTKAGIFGATPKVFGSLTYIFAILHKGSKSRVGCGAYLLFCQHSNKLAFSRSSSPLFNFSRNRLQILITRNYYYYYWKRILTTSSSSSSASVSLIPVKKITNLNTQRFYARGKNRRNKDDDDDEDEEEVEVVTEDVVSKLEQDMKVECEGIVAKFKKEISVLRVGRANPDILANIKLADGTPLSKIANIYVKDPKTLGVAPKIPALVGAIEKASIEADNGCTPRRERETLIVALPKVTAELKASITKQTTKFAENSKVAIRGIRQEFVGKVKRFKNTVSKDKIRQTELQLQRIHDSKIFEIESHVEAKLKAIAEQ